VWKCVAKLESSKGHPQRQAFLICRILSSNIGRAHDQKNGPFIAPFQGLKLSEVFQRFRRCLHSRQSRSHLGYRCHSCKR
jgi:hypothetical protein